MKTGEMRIVDFGDIAPLSIYARGDVAVSDRKSVV